MKRTRWLGLAVVAAAVVVGAVSFGQFATATGTGPKITSAGGGTKVVTSAFNITLTTDGSALDAYSGYNASLVYDSSAVTATGFVDNSVGSGLFGSTFCPPPSLANNFGGALTPPLFGAILGCTSLSAPTSTVAGGLIATASFTADTVGVTAIHQVAAGAPDFGGGSFGTYTINAADSSIQLNTYACGDGGAFVLAMGYCGPLPVPGSQAWDNVINIVNPPPDVSMNKTASVASTVAGQPVSFTLTVNNPSPTTAATNVVITDVLPSAYPGANVTFSGTNAADCSIASQTVTCGPTSIAPSGTWTANIDVSATDPNSGGTSPNNCATVTIAESDPSTANNTDCAVVQIIAPAVAWSKTPTTANIFLQNAAGTFTFQEVMTNQGDPNGLGGFSFDLHYDPTQYNAPVIDMSPAIALFAASGRTLDCTIGTAANGLIHVACASTGPIGTGPVFVGSQVMANVTLTLQAFVQQSIRPNKENGDVSWVKDDQVQVTNTCGQPLNDGTIQPLPGQPECQGNPLQGVGPSGILDGNPNGGESVQTWRRLEGDITKDCTVDVSDMQNEASRYGSSVGNLLYNLFYDVNSPLQRGDGEIDINDVQFVYGRMGSTCASPIPPQPPASLP